MATFKLEGGDEFPAINSEDWRADECAEAENALKINAGSANFAETWQLTFFISRRRANPTALVHVVADEAKRMKLGMLNTEDDEEAEAGPLGDPEPMETSVTDEQPTTGPLRSVHSG